MRFPRGYEKILGDVSVSCTYCIACCIGSNSWEIKRMLGTYVYVSFLLEAETLGKSTTACGKIFASRNLENMTARMISPAPNQDRRPEAAPRGGRHVYCIKQERARQFRLALTRFRTSSSDDRKFEGPGIIHLMVLKKAYDDTEKLKVGGEPVFIES